MTVRTHTLFMTFDEYLEKYLHSVQIEKQNDGFPTRTHIIFD